MVPPQRHRSPPNWDTLDAVEIRAVNHLNEKLRDVAVVFRTCYDAGVLAPTLRTSRKRSSDRDFAALFLKRALGDWRGLWVLLRHGYTAQAGTVASALWENSLTCVAFLYDPSAVDKIGDPVQGNVPWSARELAEITARYLQERAHRLKEEFSDLDVQSQWRVLYGMYNWLCNLKHPTVRAAFYESKNTQVSATEYVLMALPDTRDEDLRTKHSIVALVVLPLYYAIRSYGEHVDPSRHSPKSQEFYELLHTGQEAFQKLIDDLPSGCLPVNNRHSRIAQEWAQITCEKGKRGT